MRGITAVLLFLTTGLSSLLSGCVSPSYLILEEDFEGGLDRWEEGRDLPVDPRTGEPVGASIEIVNWGRSGRSILMMIDGRQDDGTLWIQTTWEVNRTGEYEVRLEFYLYSESASFNMIAQPVALVSTDPPVAENSFQTLGNANPEAGWNRFFLETELHLVEGDRLYMAIGITVAWETQMSYAFDDVKATAR